MDEGEESRHGGGKIGENEGGRKRIAGEGRREDQSKRRKEGGGDQSKWREGGDGDKDIFIIL